MANPRVSIIIRTKNEERWISSCLTGVFSQTYPNFEVILVDNESTDRTVTKASAFKLAGVITCRDYTPGKALNLGIRTSSGDRIVCLSGHCIPVSDRWLANLVRNLDEESIGGAYGRQEPMAFTPDADKRDLTIAFGLDRKVQVRDSFFHNANSVLRRDIWEKIPFDERLTNIEDRAWAQQVLKLGYRILYDPEASVYHYHGIHHNGDPKRCESVVKVLERLQGQEAIDPIPLHLDLLNAVAIIPVRGPVQILDGKPLIAYTVERAKQAKYIKQVIVSTDDPEVARIARLHGAETPFLRPSELSRDFVDLEQVISYSLEQIEARGLHPDLIVLLEATFPFRPLGMLDDMIVQLVRTGMDSILVGKRESQAIWKQAGNVMQQVDSGYVPRKYKESVFIGYKGLGCVTHPSFIREGHLLGGKLGIYEIAHGISFLEVREEQDFEIAGKLIREWWFQR